MLGSGNTSEGARRKSGSTESKTLTGKMSIDAKRPPRVKSPLGECKSPQDNQMDSGFMSGSNLQSSSSLCSGELGSKDIEFSLNSRIHSDEGQSNTSKKYTSDNLDSGIDLSERISSLDISSAGPSLSPAQSPDPHASAGVISAPSSAEPRSRPGLGLSPAHITILKEIFKKDNDGDTQLHVAVIRGFVEVVGQITSLLPHQALLDIPNNSGRTALHLAVGSGDSCVARHLIVCGASPVAKNRKGETPLHIACRDGDPCMVSWLTSQVTVYEVVAARLSYPPNHTPGLLAADLNNYDGQTCIHIAAQHGHQQILQHLTWYGADINAKEGKCGRTALHLAVEARNKELVRFLVESCRAEISIRNYAGLTPYQLAVANEAPELVSLLDELGAQKDPLPPAYSADEDLECEEDSSSLETDEEYQWTVNDLRFGSGHHYAHPIPVSSHSPFNADQYL